MSEKTNHLSNTLITLSDNKIGVDAGTDNAADYYEARVLSATDYYAFGMAMKERTWQSEKYRYGFNGKENDTDWEVQDYGFRIYKPELAKFLSVDPLTQSYPWYTPYQFAGNKPIECIDLDGLEEISIHDIDWGAKTFTVKIKKIYYLRTSGVLAVPNSDSYHTSVTSSNPWGRARSANVVDVPSVVNPTLQKATAADIASGNFWKANFTYDIKVINIPTINENITINGTIHNLTIQGIANINNKYLQNRALYGEIKMATTNYNNASPKRGFVGGYTVELNPSYYGTSPSNVIGTTQNDATLLTHEIGHNFGLSHPVGQYPSLGLMSTEAHTIYPTDDNSIDIFNYSVNLQNNDPVAASQTRSVSGFVTQQELNIRERLKSMKKWFTTNIQKDIK